jgi:hypothetical protein
MDDVVREALTAIQRRAWERLKPLLHSHPDLHWRRCGESTLSGRSRVMAWLVETPPLRASESCELRDGQIYRWHEPS